MVGENDAVSTLCESLIEVCFRLKDVPYDCLSHEDQIFVRFMNRRSGNFLRHEESGKRVTKSRPSYMKLAA